MRDFLKPCNNGRCIFHLVYLVLDSTTELLLCLFFRYWFLKGFTVYTINGWVNLL